MARWRWPWKRDPDAAGDREAAVEQALVAALDGETGEAERLLAGVVRADPDAVEPYLALARLYRNRGEIGRAIQLHQNLLLRNDLDDRARFEALQGLADDFRRGGFLRRAIAAYEEVLAWRQDFPAALRALVGLLVDVREARRAIPLARRLAKLEGREPGLTEAPLWVDVGEAERAEGRNPEARRAFRRALRRDATCVRAWLSLGEVEAELGRPKQALAAWKRVAHIDRLAAPPIYPRLAATYAALGRAREHEAFLHELLAEQPEDAGARLALADALAARGETEGAIAQVRRVLDREPENLAAHAALGRVLLAEGREAELAKAYEELLGILELRSPRQEPGVLE